MPVRERTVAEGRRRGHHLNRLIGAEIRNGRRASGVSQGALGAMVDLSDSEAARVEQGIAPWLSIVHASELLSAVGLQLWANTFPAGPPIRDAGHLRLLADFEARLPPSVSCQREWPIPGDRDRRAVDLVLLGLPGRIGVEAEMVLSDIQALERDINLKQRDAQLERMILLVRGSKRNRDILRAAEALRRAFPMQTRGVLAALATGRDPGANGLVIL